MSLALLFVLQAAAPDVQPSEFDLKILPRRPSCDTGDSREIIVCGRRGAPDKARVQPLPNLYSETPIRAETRLFGDLRGKLHGESVEFIPGMKSNRILITITKPF